MTVCALRLRSALGDEVPLTWTPFHDQHTYKFNVKVRSRDIQKGGWVHFVSFSQMTCRGCSGAVTRALEKKTPQDIESFDVSLEKQEVIVKSDLPYEAVEATIKKTGKTVSQLLMSLSSYYLSPVVLGSYRSSLVKLLLNKFGCCLDINAQFCRVLLSICIFNQ